MADVSAVDEATSLVAAARADGARVRVLGGVAVALRCPSARSCHALVRAYSDIDVATTRKAARELSRVFEAAGYAPHGRFNAMHGHSRMMFARPDGMHVDVFVDEFVMCHRLDLTSRLDVHATTLPLADLLLTKLQVAELNEKDVTDAATLLLDHDLVDDEDGVNVDYLCGVLGRDWGWWRTVSDNLRALPGHVAGRLDDDAARVVEVRVGDLLERIERAPKSLGWKARAKAGDRIPWRENPEESH